VPGHWPLACWWLAAWLVSECWGSLLPRCAADRTTSGGRPAPPRRRVMRVLEAVELALLLVSTAAVPVPYGANFPPFGTWSAVQLFACDPTNANQTARLQKQQLAVGGSCLSVGHNSFGQDGQPIRESSCSEQDANQAQGRGQPQHWTYNTTDATIRPDAYPWICLHASAGQPMAPLMQKTCHSVAPKGATYDTRDQWDLVPMPRGGHRLRSRANNTLCADSKSVLPPFVCGGEHVFCDATKPIASRIRDLIGRLDLGEKTLLLSGSSPGVARLGLYPLRGGDELHGAGGCGAAAPGSSGCGTSFPHALALAATFNRSLWRMVGDAISTENRALHNQGKCPMLNPWDPDINLVRDPVRCDRAHAHTYGCG
jgi:hypothetical protein